MSDVFKVGMFVRVRVLEQREGVEFCHVHPLVLGQLELSCPRFAGWLRLGLGAGAIFKVFSRAMSLCLTR